MYNFISINVKCPSCSGSLMDKVHTVDNEPSIHLMIETGDRKGNIRLSSIYGSFNFLSDINTQVNEIVKLSCPLCNTKLETKELCRICNAPMAYLYLDMGGRVSFCTRISCKNHSVEFEDLSTALTKLYSDFSMESKHAHEYIYEKKVPVRTEADEIREIIETGTFLQSYCPHCKKSLIVDGMLKLKVRSEDSGYLMLSPYLNVFSTKSTIFLPEDKALGDIQCPFCDHTLILEEPKCEQCGSQIARIAISARTRLIDFYICSKKGCRWHGLSKEDIDEIRLDDSMEW